MVNYAQIHDLEVLDTEKLRFSDVRKNLQMADGVKRVTDIIRAPVINFIESDHEKFEQIIELLGNESFSPIQVFDDYSVNYYGDPVNFRHTLSGKDGKPRKFSITVQNDYWKLMMDWTSKESETFWDFVVEEEPIDTDDPPTGITESSGTWVVVPDTGRGGVGDYSWQCSGTGTCEIGELWLGDIELSYYFDVSSITNDVTITFKYLDSNNYYIATIDSGLSELTFEYNDSGLTTINNWVLPFTIEVDEYYEFRVVVHGNKVKLYVGGFFIGSAPIEKLISGTVRFGAIVSTGTVDFDDISLEVDKSVAIYTPVGAYDIGELRMPDTTRLNDDTFSDGIGRMIIAPDDPVEFRQEGSVYGGGEVKVFDTMNSASESDWIRVYKADRKFVGDIIISNGLIRLRYEKDTTQIITGVYTNTSWEEITFQPDWSSLPLENIKAQITELSRYYVTLREASYYETTAGFDMVWTDYTIRTGSPMIHIENRRAL